MIPAPDIEADSSNEGSMERNGAAIKRKTTGVQTTPSTKIIPVIVKMFNGELFRLKSSLSPTLINPASGPRSKIHPMALIIPGIAKEVKADR
jgi:hypothetical protein